MSNYNADTQLWVNLRISELAKPLHEQALVIVLNGHATIRGEAIGRFADNDHAHQTLSEAGWRRNFASGIATYFPHPNL